MKVVITYRDNTAFTVEEVVRQATQNYGKDIKVEVSPESSIAYDQIYFGLQQLLTHKQLGLIYDKGSNYQSDIKLLRSEILFKLEEIVDQVIIDTEAKAA